MTPLHLAILRSAALLVPVAQRAEWFAEWRAELWYVNHGATAFCLGAFRDAFWLRRNNPEPKIRLEFGLQSPLRCVSLLAILAAVSVFFAFRLPPARGDWALGRFFPAYLFMIVLSVLVLSATTSLALGEYPGKRHFRRRIFLAAKIALILPIVYCGSLDLASTVDPSLPGSRLFGGPDCRISLGPRRSAAPLPGLPAPAHQPHSNRRPLAHFPRLVRHRAHLRPGTRVALRSGDPLQLLHARNAGSTSTPAGAASFRKRSCASAASSSGSASAARRAGT